MPASQPVKKIAIFGGGLGSLTTAFALTSRRNWREHYEITVYQMGWRLGGKGASGRNPEPDCGHRIEEHGFHVWLGFYDNASKMIQESYAELARTTGPLRTWTDAFKKHSLVVIQEVIDGERKQWQIKFPEGIRTPGTVVRLGLFGYAARMFKLLYDGLPATPTRGPASIAPVLRLWQTIWRTAFIALLLCLSVAEYFLRLLENRVRRQLEETRGSAARHVLRPLHRLLAWVVRRWRTIAEASSQLVMAWADGAQVSNPDDGRRLQIFFDLSLAVLRGIIVDDIVAKGFESIDHLRVQGLASPAQRTAGERQLGDHHLDLRREFLLHRRRPDPAQLRRGRGPELLPANLSRLQGSAALQDAGGNGGRGHRPPVRGAQETGVQFKFFHRIDELVYDAVAGRISAIELTEQVILNGDYDPLVKVDVAGGQIDLLAQSAAL